MTWHTQPEAQAILSSLTEQDMRLGCRGGYESGMIWRPASEHGCRALDQLNTLREQAVSDHPLDKVWRVGVGTVANAALTQLMNDVPTVAAALSSRFGSPDQYGVYDAIQATRVFRASFADEVVL